jgi:Xaa-Pro dipeptidase
LLAGTVVPFRNDTDRELVFRQESNFYYLTGCTIPASFLLAAYHPGAPLSINPSLDLFIPKAELEDMMWSVPPPSLKEAKQTYDVTTVEHPAALPAAIDTLLKTLPGALFHTLPRNSPLFPDLPAEYTQRVLDADGAVTDAYLLSALHHARLVKDAYEIAAIKHANEISSRAHEVVMRVLGKAVKGKIEAGDGAGVDRPLLPGEWLIEKEAEAEAIFVASCRREGFVFYLNLHKTSLYLTVFAQCKVRTPSLLAHRRSFDPRVDTALLLQ